MTTPIKLRLLARVLDSQIPNTFFADYADERIMPHRIYHVAAINGKEIGPDGVGYTITLRRVRNIFGDPLNFLEGRGIVTIEFNTLPAPLIGMGELDEWASDANAVEFDLY